MKDVGLFCLSFIVINFLSSSFSYAQSPLTQSSSSANIRATVEGRILNLSGIIAPNASVVLSAESVVYKGAVADGSGKFVIPDVQIAQGLREFCLEAVDVKRLGSSLACFSITPGEKESTQDIFLPPTLGLQRDQIVEGSEAVVFGYSMPTAQVQVEVKNGQKSTVTADASGYYQYAIPNLTVGSYQLVAGATYEAKSSAPSLRPALLKTISVGDAVEDWLGINWWLLLLPLAPLFIGLGIWWYRRKKQLEHKLHHWWFVGY